MMAFYSHMDSLNQWRKTKMTVNQAWKSFHPKTKVTALLLYRENPVILIDKKAYSHINELLSEYGNFDVASTQWHTNGMLIMYLATYKENYERKNK